MKIFVISLRSSMARRAHIREQLEPLGLEYEFFAAIEGADGYRFFDPDDQYQFFLNTGRRIVDGEVGCYASHLALWHECRRVNEPILIMEDDATVDPHFEAALSEADRLIGRYGFIRLQHGQPRRGLRSIEVERSTKFSLHYCQRFPFGAMCYAISPQVADAFILGSRVMTGPVDLFIKRFWEHKQALFFLFPPAVDGGGLHHSTTITGNREPRKPRLLRRLMRIFKKCHTMVARANFNAKTARSLSAAMRDYSSTSEKNGRTSSRNRGLTRFM